MIDTAGVAASIESRVTEEETLQADLGRKAVLSLLRAVANMRFYLPNNPLVVRSKEETHENLTKFLDTWEILPVELTGSEMVCKGEPVNSKPDDKSHNLAFLLYRDGLRAITFHKGISLEELDRFMAILCDTLNSPEEELDVVSSLWNADFVHITYVAIEPFLEMDGESAEAAPPDEEIRPRTGNVYDNADNLKTAITPPMTEVPPSRRESSRNQLLGEVDSEQVKKSVQSQVQFSPLLALGSILLDLLGLEEGYEERRHIVTLMVEYLKEMISQARLTESSDTISRARLSLRYMASRDERYNELLEYLLSETADFVCSTENKKRIRDSFAQDPLGMLALIEATGPRALATLLELVPAVGDTKIKASIRTVLVTLASEDILQLKEAVNSTNPSIAKEAIAVLGRIGDPKSVQLLRPCVRNCNSSVRTQVLHALAQIDSPQASRLAFEFLKDQDMDVRILAARTFDISKEKTLEKKLTDMISDKSFRLRPTPEKIALIEALKKGKPDGVVPILTPFFGGKLFRKREDEGVLLAVAATLSSIGTCAAVKALEKGTKSRRKAVAMECLRELTQLRVNEQG